MSSEKIINTLLMAAAPVTAIVSTRISAGELAQGSVLPALGISHISTVEVSTIDASAPFKLVQTRIEVTVLAKDYPTVKDLIKKVRAACNYQRGVIGGFTVISIVRDTVGPDMRDSDLTVFSQTIDFKVTWQEPNP